MPSPESVKVDTFLPIFDMLIDLRGDCVTLSLANTMLLCRSGRLGQDRIASSGNVVP